MRLWFAKEHRTIQAVQLLQQTDVWKQCRLKPNEILRVSQRRCSNNLEICRPRSAKLTTSEFCSRRKLANIKRRRSCKTMLTRLGKQIIKPTHWDKSHLLFVSKQFQEMPHGTANDARKRLGVKQRDAKD